MESQISAFNLHIYVTLRLIARFLLAAAGHYKCICDYGSGRCREVRACLLLLALSATVVGCGLSQLAEENIAMSNRAHVCLRHRGAGEYL